MKKVLSLMLILAVMLSFSACTSSKKEATYTVGIVEYGEHSAQSLTVQGFTDFLTEQLGSKVSFDRQHASSDAGSAALIVNKFVSQNVDLILADTTQSLQIAASSTSSIPVLGSAVTDYSSAVDMAINSASTGVNISGTSDLAPLGSQAEMILELFPDVKNVGLLYCSAEVNSLYQVNVIQQYLTKKGVLCKEFAFSDPNDLPQVAQAAIEYSDVIFLPTDNTIAECTAIIDGICRPAHVPVVAGEEGICRGCGVATLSIDYYALGRKTGEMAYRILAEGADISQMPIEYDDAPVKMYNKEICAELGITVPQGYIAIE